MKLRTRLALAFFLMSVLPIAAITLYSYYASLAAFRRAAAAEAGVMAGQMAQRMEFVTADLQQRVDRMWSGPPEPARPEGPALERQPDEVRARLAEMLGSAAGLVQRIEFLPAPAEAPSGPARPAEPAVVASVAPAPKVPPAPPAPPTAPRTGGRPGAMAGVPPPPPRPQRIVVDLSELEKLKANVPILGELTAEQIASVSSLVVRQIETGLRAAERGMAREAEQGRSQVRGASDAGADRARRMWVMPEKRTPREMGFSVGRGDEVVGTVRTHLNLDRTLHAVMTMTRSEQGEIPFALDPDQHIYTPRPGDASRLEALKIADRTRAAAGETSGKGDDWIVVTKEDPSGVVFGIARPIGPALREIRRTAASNLVLGVSVMALAFIGVVPLSRRMTRNLSGLTEGVRAIAQGDLAVRVPVRSRDEIGELAGAVNQMAQDLEAHQKLLVQQERLQRELELCRLIQNEMLPHDTLRSGLAEVRGVSLPAREVGGDFFNYFVLPQGDLALLVGDVSGKGVGAALLMANIQATLRARLPLENDLRSLVAAIDQEIEQNTPRGVYVTLFVGIFTPATKTLRYVNAGHNPQFVLRAGGALDRLPSTGLPVGMFAGHGYEERSVSMADGDQLFFYTDGTVEVENEAGDMFGSERLEARLHESLNAGVDGLLADVEAAIRKFRGAAEPFDDQTMMVLRLGGVPVGAGASRA